MLETRRAFLQKLLVTAIAIGVDPLRYVTTAGDVYRNTRLGLSLRRPARWEFSSIADFATLRERQVVMDMEDEDVHPLKDPVNLPVFLFENPEGRDGLFGPALALYDEALDGPPPEDQALAHKEVMLAGFAASYRGFDLLQEPMVVTVQGAKGTWSHWSYLHELDDGTNMQLSVRSLVVFRAPRVHTFHFVESPTSPRRPEAIWVEFIRSISYEPLSA